VHRGCKLLSFLLADNLEKKEEERNSISTTKKKRKKKVFFEIEKGRTFPRRQFGQPELFARVEGGAINDRSR